jgi:hypothetical protein
VGHAAAPKMDQEKSAAKDQGVQSGVDVLPAMNFR